MVISELVDNFMELAAGCNFGLVASVSCFIWAVLYSWHEAKENGQVSPPALSELFNHSTYYHLALFFLHICCLLSQQL